MWIGPTLLALRPLSPSNPPQAKAVASSSVLFLPFWPCQKLTCYCNKKRLMDFYRAKHWMRLAVSACFLFHDLEN